MEPDAEFFDAFESPDFLSNFNINDSNNVSSALKQDEYFLNQMPPETFNNTSSEDKDRQSPLLLDEENEPIINDETNSDTSPSIDDKKEKWRLDEAAIEESQMTLTDEEKQTRRDESKELKSKGNKAFEEGDYSLAETFYNDALKKCLISDKNDRAILFSNRAACKIQSNQLESAIEDCSKAIECNPVFVRALLRRANCYEKTDKLDEALVDYQKILELDPSVPLARSACTRLPDQIKERNEKLKDEMIGKLKDLGNLVLRPFGLSTNNFKVQQDPSTGSYSINFQQNPKQE